jgi:uncharacterized protein YdeI (YjbR/CyaY-like superfamily)
VTDEQGTPFAAPEQLRAWLEANHATAAELWVRLARKGSGIPSITWPELVDEVLCFGWIDGHAKGIDDVWRRQRITPRKRGSTWSARNVARAEALIAEGRMRPAGLAAFQARREDRTAVYTYERDGHVVLPPAYEQRLRADAEAAAFLDRQVPSYRRTVFAWVARAKQESTRERRLAQLIECSARGEAPPPYRWAKLKP